MEETKVTIVCVPRDHFSDTQQALDSIYQNTDVPFSLIYVDGRSPRRIAEYLKKQAEIRHFSLIRKEIFLSPNHARNMGAEQVRTPYTVFIDNDVVVAPGWLKPLLDCAEKTGAGIVGPLTYESLPLHTHLHFVGGDAHIDQRQVDGRTENHIVDKIFKEPVPSGPTLTECAEFHCMLVQTAAFRAVGGLDEKMLSTRENLDFCMALRQAGYDIYLEPSSKITYLPPVKMKMEDMAYFALRWSDDWDKSSFRHFIEKWNLAEDDYFAREYANLGWRRRGLMMNGGLLRWVPTWKLRLALNRLIRPWERRLNRKISDRHARRHLKTDAA